MLSSRMTACLALCVTGLAAAPVQAQSDTAAYDQALASLQNELAAEGGLAVCGFVFSPPGEGAPDFRFDGTGEGGQWFDPSDAPVDLEETSLPPEGQVMITLRASMFESVEPVRHLRDEAGIAIFAIRTENFTINGMGQEANIAPHLTGEVGVARDSGRFTYVRYYAENSFKPAPVARIRTFEHRVDVAPAWPDGPLVRSSARTAMNVSAMFQTHEVDDRMNFSDFQTCG